AVLLDGGIDAVDRTRIVVIQPGGEDAQPAQFAPPLVRIDVVRVVASRPGVAILTDDLAWDVAAGQRANRSVRRPRRVLEPLPDVVHLDRPLLPGLGPDLRAFGDFEPRDVEIGRAH